MNQGQVLLYVCVCPFVLWESCAYQGLWRDNTHEHQGSSTDTFPPYLSSQNTQEVKNFEISFSSTYTFFKGAKSQHWRGTSQLAGTWSTIPLILPFFRSQTLATPLTLPLLLVPDSPCTLPDQHQTWLISHPMSASLSLPPPQTWDRKQQFKRLSEAVFLKQRPMQQVPREQVSPNQVKRKPWQSQAKMDQMQLCSAFPAQGGHGSNAQLPAQLCSDRCCLELKEKWWCRAVPFEMPFCHHGGRQRALNKFICKVTWKFLTAGEIWQDVPSTAL